MKQPGWRRVLPNQKASNFKEHDTVKASPTKFRVTGNWSIILISSNLASLQPRNTNRGNLFGDSSSGAYKDSIRGTSGTPEIKTQTRQYIIERESISTKPLSCKQSTRYEFLKLSLSSQSSASWPKFTTMIGCLEKRWMDSTNLSLANISENNANKHISEKWHK